MIWVDGVFVAEAPPVAGDDGSLFETMGQFDGRLRWWDRHCARLADGLLRVGDPVAFSAALRADLHRAAHELLRHNGHDVLCLERRLRPRGGSWLLTTRARKALAIVRLLPTVARRPVDAPPADLKARPRAFYDAVRAEAKLGGADDGIAIGDDGALLETATGNLWLLLDSVWTTPPLDGRVLPGIARALLLEHARAAAVLVAERRCDFGDLHRATAISVSNAAYGPRPAALVGVPVAEADTSLAHLWRIAVAN